MAAERGELRNIEAYPRAGLAFVDFESGAALQVTGTAGIDQNPVRIAEFPGAQRLVRLEVDRVVEIGHRFPVPVPLVAYSPFDPRV